MRFPRGAVCEQIRSWLAAVGLRQTALDSPAALWSIRAEDSVGRVVMVKQSVDAPDLIRLEATVRFTDEHQARFAALEPEQRSQILWELRFRLLAMNVDFAGIDDPLCTVSVAQRLFLDALDQDRFFQRFMLVRNAVIAVIWTVTRRFEGHHPPPPGAYHFYRCSEAGADESDWEACAV